MNFEWNNNIFQPVDPMTAKLRWQRSFGLVGLRRKVPNAPDHIYIRQNSRQAFDQRVAIVLRHACRNVFCGGERQIVHVSASLPSLTTSFRNAALLAELGLPVTSLEFSATGGMLSTTRS
ncbi:hypothetical protein D9M71_650930 [compost metagenome]